MRGKRNPHALVHDQARYHGRVGLRKIDGGAIAGACRVPAHRLRLGRARKRCFRCRRSQTRFSIDLGSMFAVRTGRWTGWPWAGRFFPRPEDRRWLEDLVHPEVFSVWRTEFAQAPESDWVVEVPLLFEKGLENWFDFTVCVALSGPRQYLRLERRGLSRELAEQRISTQLLLATKLELADFVIWNDGSSAFLDAQVATLASLVRSD
jgi:hypothetical protein